MITIKQIDEQIEKLQKQKEELIKLEKSKDFIEVKHKNKTFRIYKWENRPIQDFIYPNGFRMSEFQEFNELIESGFELEVWKYYLVKHFNKLQWNKKYCLSGLCLGRDADLYSYDGSLAGSDDNGRVVVVKDGGK